MSPLTRRRHPLLAVLLLALVAALTTALMVGPVAPGASAAESGKVRGNILQAGGGPAPQVKLLWFASDWTYLGARKTNAGGYSLALPPGTYYLQAVDQRPAYDVTKNSPATVKVTVRAGHTTAKNLVLRRGASFGGTVKAGGKPAKGARVVAANTAEQSFETTADSQGRYALGGLPPGKYSVFTYDRSATWVDKSVYLGQVKGSAFRTLDIGLNKRAGSLLVDLYTGGAPFKGAAFVTAVSKATGQFWTAKAGRGSVTFRGLAPGRYRLVVPALGNYLPATVSVRAVVRPSRLAFGDARLSKRGGWITGTVVDENDQHTLAGATVRLLAQDGRELDRTTSSRTGAFVLDGLLTTQRGLTIVTGPGPYSPFLDNCPYRVQRTTDVALTTNRRTDVGAVGLRLTNDAPAQCTPKTPQTPRAGVDARRTP